MWLSSVSITGFRNLKKVEANLSPGVNILHGLNAQGKTSFLEAIYFCAFGRSPRAIHDRELINFDQDQAHIQAEVYGGPESPLTSHKVSHFTLDAYIQKIGGKSKKGLAINQVSIPHIKDLFGKLLVVMFSPEDLQLIKAGPTQRRRFMDMEICQLSPVYYQGLKEYHRALKQRNALLKAIQKDKSQQDMLEVWDIQLATHGRRIMRLRQQFIANINTVSKQIHSQITAGAEELSLIYQPSMINPGGGKNDVDDVDIIDNNAYLAALKKSHKRDILQGTTTVGIHKDDVEFTINNISARFFGSQGQQRTAALSAKLAEIEIIKQTTNQSPILLLDDVLSELDGNRQAFLLEEIKTLQTLVTCTGLEDALLSITNSKKAAQNPGQAINIIEISNGDILGRIS